MNIKTKIATGLLCACVTVMAGIAQVFARNDVLIEAYATDTIAGYSTTLRTSLAPANEKLTFEVKNSVGEVTKLPFLTNSNGVGILELSDYFTRRAGRYQVAVLLSGNSYAGKANFFTVHPDQVSGQVSTVNPSNQVIHYSGEKAYFTVKLLDKFSNPVEGHLVKLISSSGNDVIKTISKNGLTDGAGEMKFEVSGRSSGVVSYSAYDATKDVVLSSRAKVVYFNSNAEIFNQTASVQPGPVASYAALGNSSGAVDHFKVEDVPAVIKTGDKINLKITSYDANEQVVSNYSGKIRFSVDGDQSKYAELPQDYGFTINDQGSHVFSLAFSFSQAGGYKMKVTDLANLAVFGEQQLDVVKSNDVTLSGSASGSVKIINPIAGSYSNNSQVISGLASVGAKLKIFDNDVELGSVVVDASGKFSFTTGLLADGLHKIYVASVNDVGTIIDASQKVDVNVDTKSAGVSKVVLEPSGPVDPGTVVTVKVFSDGVLSKAQVLLQGNVYELTKSEGGYYQTTFAAPIEFGQYKLKFNLMDELGNEVKLQDNYAIQVGTLLPGEKLKPGKVTGLQLTPGDRRVILKWDGPGPGSAPIQHYQVIYGLSPTKLTEAVDTFTASTTWYVPNLQNGTDYYFAVVGVDAAGNKSSVYDKILLAKPGSAVENVQTPAVKNGTAGKDALKYMKTDAAKSGPEAVWLIICSAFGGVCYSFFKGRSKSEMS